MTPSHTNKGGARYRYYVSHAILQNRPDEAGAIARVPAPDVESIVIEALRDLDGHADNGGSPAFANDRDLVEHHVDRIIIRPQAIEIHVLDKADGEEQAQNRDGIMEPGAGSHSTSIIAVPWSATPAGQPRGSCSPLKRAP